MIKYLITNSYAHFITIFLNKCVDNKYKGFLIDYSDDIDANEDIDHELHMEMELLTIIEKPYVRPN